MITAIKVYKAHVLYLRNISENPVIDSDIQTQTIEGGKLQEFYDYLLKPLLFIMAPEPHR